MPFYAIVCLPVLFAAGMALLDTIDGAFMGFAYDWALARPVRRLYYNLTVTGLSVAVALGIGTVELLSVAVERSACAAGSGRRRGSTSRSPATSSPGCSRVTWAVRDRWSGGWGGSSSAGRCPDGAPECDAPLRTS